jgi:hypothetical protein
LKHHQINTYKSIKDCNVKNTISIEQWLDAIKNPEIETRNTILAARIIGKGNPAYDALKEIIPCVTYNFLFNKYKKNTNIISTTGLIYIDVDKSNFNINLIDKSKILAYYKSFGGIGYSIILKVNGLTLNNFKSTYLAISNELGIINYIDVNAIKASQFNVQSFDADLFYNPDSTEFEATNLAPPSRVNKKEEKTYTHDGGAEPIYDYKNIRFNDLDKIQFGGDYVVNWDGWNYIKCWIPFKKLKSGKNDYFLSYTSNLVYLNPNLSQGKVLSILLKINPLACSMPVPEEQLKRIVKSVFEYKNNGTLKPILFNKKRYIVFRPELNWTQKQKLDICRAEMSKHWKDVSSQKLYQIIEKWDFVKYPKITQRAIYKNFPISKKTVEKYYHLFLDYVQELNLEFKNHHQGLLSIDNSYSVISMNYSKSLSELLSDYITENKAFYMNAISRSKTMNNLLMSVADKNDINLLYGQMSEYWFLDELKNNFFNYYLEYFKDVA